MLSFSFFWTGLITFFTPEKIPIGWKTRMGPVAIRDGGYVMICPVHPRPHQVSHACVNTCMHPRKRREDRQISPTVAAPTVGALGLHRE